MAAGRVARQDATMSVAQPISAATFAAEVLDASAGMPVLVDFWAPWCGPCRTLGPILDDVAREYAGRVKVVKLNTDDEPALATQFQIRGIPAVKLFRHGKVVAEFVGAQPAGAVRSFLKPHLPTTADDPATQARTLQAQGRHGEAVALLRTASAAAGSDDATAIELGRALALAGDPAVAEALVDRLSPALQADGPVRAVRALAHFARIVASPDETDAIQTARVAAARALLRDDLQAGLDSLVAAMQRNRRYATGQGRADLVQAFALAAPEHPGVAAARRSLAALLH
jgi:putative thioredoxin